MINKQIKLILKIGLILLFSINCSLVFGQRNLIWSHGLQETNVAWQTYINHFNTVHTVNTVNQPYNSTNGLVSAANEIRQDLDNQLGSGNTNANNIGIAHGTAGLAYRQIDGTTSSSNKRFGGFITLGTPNHGVYFADAQSNGDLAAYTTDALDKLKLGVKYFENGQVVMTDEDLANFAQNFANQYLGSSTTQTDLKTNSTFMSSLPAHFSKPTISIHGNENAQAQWRLFSSFEDKPHSLGLNNLGSEKVLTIANLIENKYKSQITSSSVSIFVGLVALVVPVALVAGFVTGAIASTTANIVGAWIVGGALTGISSAFLIPASIKLARAIKGKNWFKDSETKWKRLTGAIRTQTYSYTYSGMSQYCLNQIAQFGWGWYYGNSANQQLCYGQPVTITGTQYINESSDGLIPFSSTQLPFATSLEAAGANHFELYNHPSVKARFDEIYSGTHGSFFQL